MVRHQDAAAADGGHTRVVVANHFAKDGQVDFAQASSDTAVVRSEGVDALYGETAVYLLRPNQGG